VAVVYASGAITTGDGGESINPIMGGSQVGSRRFIRHLRSAREDEDVRAIVIRVNSPGGELSPSIEIWREVSLAAAEKPVVVSMGGVAASGGYYIAAPATEIFADATTVTGSIGVFALAFNLNGLYEETIGINTEVVRTAPHADLLSLTRDMTPEETEFAAREIEAVYNEFLRVVGNGRSLDVDDVRQHAEGRVWTGLQAKERGLVDEIGGLYASIERAAELAEIEGEYDIVVVPRPLDRIEQIFSMLSDLSQVPAHAELLRLEGMRALLEQELRRRSGIQVRLNGWGGVR
jgi:protease-4